MRFTRRAGLIALLVGSPCYGGVLLYDNGVTATDNYIVSDNSPSADQLVADDFALGSTAYTVTSIQWRGTYGRQITPADDNFTILIHADDGGRPAANALHTYESASVVRSEPDANYVFSYVADIAPTTLSPGVTYWLSIFEDLPVDYRWAWIFQFDQPEGNLYYRAEIGQPYGITIPYETDFQLVGSAVPEPGSSALLLTSLGLAALLVCRPKRKSSCVH